MSTHIHLGRNIRCLRLLRGMKQELFAHKMGITQQRVSRLEQQRRITSENLQAAAKALNVSVSTIETFDERSVIKPKSFEIAGSAEPTIQEVAEYFSAELAKRDKKIHELEAALNAVIAQSTRTNQGDVSKNS